MRHTPWACLAMWGALILLCLFAPRLAFAGARGLLSGDWRLWHKWTIGLLEI